MRGGADVGGNVQLKYFVNVFDGRKWLGAINAQVSTAKKGHGVRPETIRARGQHRNMTRMILRQCRDTHMLSGKKLPQ